MTRPIVESVSRNEAEDADEEFEAETESVTIRFYDHWIEQNYESFPDGYLNFSPEELIELRDKINEVLA